MEAATSTAAPPHARRTDASIDWEALIKAARVQSLSTPLYDGQLNLRYARELAVARSAQRLVARGFRVERNRTQLCLSNEHHDRLTGRLEELIRELGGLNILRELFRKLAGTYDVSSERYMVVRDVAVHSRREPDFPWGYLIALSAKHLDRGNGRALPDGLWQELFDLATDYAAVHDVQDYTPPIFERIPSDKLVATLTKRALYDSIHTFPQLRSSDVLRMLRPLLAEIPADRPYGPGWTITDIFAVIEHVYQVIGGRRGPVTLNLRHIARTVPDVAPPLAKHILVDVLSHPSAGANTLFSRPTDQAERGVDPLTGPGNSLHLRPLLRLKGKRAVVIDRTVAGPAMVEAALSAVRKYERADWFQSKVIGVGAETLIRREFAEHGIAVHTGDYDAGAVHGECDIVLDEPGHLVFIESKAKPLTRNAANGHDVDVLLSLAGSVVAAMEQSFGHEMQLRKHGQLALYDQETKKVTHRLKWAGQTVTRVALSLYDFGYFQDHTAISKFLWPMMNAQYGAIDPEMQRRFESQFKKLNEKVLPELVRHMQVWKELGFEGKDPFFPGSWFMSAPQLFALLDGVHGPTEFLERLAFLTNVTYQSYNFHHQLSHALRLKADRDARVRTDRLAGDGGDAR